ncbi:pulmonary surfactant-associated protein A-like [Haliotis rufescens]|uniref:pulmonary surfactant-associated protein A-like n=1 Tax=Haliotis rufescens TaxID=6454 RepID=UPI001EAF94AF|nr:pulmonary surfactant-associated protein A-like [Haliotis rufescens]
MRLTLHHLIIMGLDLCHIRLQCSMAYVQQLKFSHSEHYKDKLRTTRIVKIGSARSMLHCAQLCSEMETCISFFHNKITRHCSLHDVIFFSPDDGTDCPGMKYYVFDHGGCSVTMGFIYSRISKVCFSIRTTDGHMTWPESKLFCKIRKFRLATVDSKEKYEYTVATIRENSRFLTTSNYYIGLSDRAKEGKFVWIDGTPAHWTKWSPGRPKTDVNRNCVMLGGNAEYNGELKFVEKDCGQNRFLWICEKVLT